MGVGGTLEYLSDLMGSRHHHHHHHRHHFYNNQIMMMMMMKKNKPFQTVELKVSMDCDGCELKVKKALSSLRGVESVEINRKQQKVTVTGYVEASKVLKKAKSTGKKAEIWPYVPYNLVPHPYAPPAYDKKAPPGYVRNVDITSASSIGTLARYEDPYVTFFSDDNPNACSVM